MRLPSISPLLLLALAALPACTAAPKTTHRRSPIDAAARVLALDFVPHAATETHHGLDRLTGIAAKEGRRVAGLRPPTDSTGAEIARIADARRNAVTLASADLRRRPDVRAALPRSPHDLAQTLADGLGTLSVLFAPRQPLGEIDDQRHRTDPAEAPAEASLLARLRRRLRL